eukprot:COSAG03_NODE_10_length_23829_cov_21.731395_17_plen_323_part_00
MRTPRPDPRDNELGENLLSDGINGSVEVEQVQPPLVVSAPRPSLPTVQAATVSSARFPDWTVASNGKLHNVTPFSEPQTAQQLSATIATEGQKIAANASQNMAAMNSHLSYESLIQGFMTTGESATTFIIGYESLKMWEYGKKEETEKELPAGKALITTQRLLFLSCQPTYHTNIAKTGTPHLGQSQGHYELLYKAANSVSYQPIPLGCFRALSMSMETATRTTSVVNKNMPSINKGLCCGCCQNLGTWVSQSSAVSVSERFIEMAFEGAFVRGFEGAWGMNQKMAVQINFASTTSMPEVQAWASALQAACPKIMNPQDMSR